MITFDPISDLITSINNTIMNDRNRLEVPFSTLKYKILILLQNEGIIKKVDQVKRDKFLVLDINLGSHNSKFKKISKPGRRVYVKYAKIPKNKKEILVLSTPKGIMTATSAIKENIGGELLMEIL